MNEDRFDKDGNYKIFKGVLLPAKNGISQKMKKMKPGESLKADSVSEAQRIASVMYKFGWKARQYKTGKGFWWVQRIK